MKRLCYIKVLIPASLLLCSCERSEAEKPRSLQERPGADADSICTERIAEHIARSACSCEYDEAKNHAQPTAYLIFGGDSVASQGLTLP